MPSLYQAIQIVNRSTYKLDMSGVVGMLGGDKAGDALETIHLYAGRRWAGWYNYPGALTVAKRFGQVAESRLWDSLFPGPDHPPAMTFGLAGKSGFDYIGSFSGTRLRTKYLGYLVAEACESYPCKMLRLFNKDGSEGRKTGSSAAVAVISLPPRQSDRVRHSPTVTTVGVAKENYELISVRPIHDPPLALWAIVPSLVSIVAVVFCLLGRDHLCASLVLAGIVCSGLSSLALGSAALKIHVPVPSTASPPGDGIMCASDGSVIVLKGEEADVNVITKGEFVLDYSTGILADPNHNTIGITSLLLMAQFVVQLLLIPRSTLFGQILFLASFITSGLYHLYVVSYDKEKAQRDLLLRELSVRVDKRLLGTRTQMAVFVCLVVGDSRRSPSTSKPDITLSQIIPNNTPIWNYWRKKVLKELERFWEHGSQSPSPYVPSIHSQPEDQAEKDEYSHFTSEDTRLLEDLIGDAWCVFNGFPEWRDGDPKVWRLRDDHADEKAHSPSEGSPV